MESSKASTAHNPKMQFCQCVDCQRQRDWAEQPDYWVYHQTFQAVSDGGGRQEAETKAKQLSEELGIPCRVYEVDFGVLGIRTRYSPFLVSLIIPTETAFYLGGREITRSSAFERPAFPQGDNYVWVEEDESGSVKGWISKDDPKIIVNHRGWGN